MGTERQKLQAALRTAYQQVLRGEGRPADDVIVALRRRNERTVELPAKASTAAAPHRQSTKGRKQG